MKLRIATILLPLLSCAKPESSSAKPEQVTHPSTRPPLAAQPAQVWAPVTERKLALYCHATNIPHADNVVVYFSGLKDSRPDEMALSENREDAQNPPERFGVEVASRGTWPLGTYTSNTDDHLRVLSISKFSLTPGKYSTYEGSYEDGHGHDWEVSCFHGEKEPL